MFEPMFCESNLLKPTTSVLKSSRDLRTLSQGGCLPDWLLKHFAFTGPCKTCHSPGLFDVLAAFLAVVHRAAANSASWTT